MGDIVLTVLGSSTVVALLLSAAVYWGRNLILNRLKGAVKLEMDKKLELYKDQLKTQSEERLAIMRNNLQQALKEHEIIFSKLHEKQMEVLAEIYGRAVDFKSAVAQYINYFLFHNGESEPLEERETKCLDAMENFTHYSLRNAIYLHPDHAKNLRDFDQQLWGVMNDFKFNVMDTTKQKERLEAWKEIQKIMQNDVQKIFENLEDESRRILGVLPKI